MKALAQPKGFWFFIIPLLGFLGVSNLVLAQDIGDYNYMPPFLGVDIQPNILLLLDNSGSMNSCAYPNAATTGSSNCQNTPGNIHPFTDYNATKSYSGYFDGGKCYEYIVRTTGSAEIPGPPAPFGRPPNPPAAPAVMPTGKFTSAQTKVLSCTNPRPWDGNFLNWLTMRRIDIAKWALTGGQCAERRSRDANLCTTLRGQESTAHLIKQATLSGVAPFSGNRCILLNNGYFFMGLNPSGECYESFVDRNNNKAYDGPFLGEPFEDLNRNGVRDTNEQFIDKNFNRMYDGPRRDLEEVYTDLNGNNQWDNISPEYVASKKGNTNTNRMFQIVVDTEVNSTGIIQKVGSRARFGLMVFNDLRGGKIAKEKVSTTETGVGIDLLTLVQTVEQVDATTWTPLAEALYEASRYFAQIPPAFFPTDYTVTADKDPYCYSDLLPVEGVSGCKKTEPTKGQWVDCCKSFVLIFTDGQPTKDTEIPIALQHFSNTSVSHLDANETFTDTNNNREYDPGEVFQDTNNNRRFDNHHQVCSDYYFGTYINCNLNRLEVSHYLDDVAYWAHTTDLRPDRYGDRITGINATSTLTETSLPGGGIPGMQNLNIYTFLAFEQGGNLPNILKETAKFGAFQDSNGNGIPDLQSEWDIKDNLTGTSTPDGIPDAYFFAEDAESMKANLLGAINDILLKSASGTSASFSLTSSTGEGAAYQSYFFPISSDDIGTTHWVGHLQALFVDNESNFRNDSNQDGRLSLTEDKIILTEYVIDPTNPKKGETVVSLCEPDPKTGKRQMIHHNVDPPIPDTPNLAVCTRIAGLESLDPLWEGGKLLAMRSPSSRTIKTSIDNRTLIDFGSGSARTLRRYLGALTDNEGEKIINFIRGEKDLSNFRNRQRLVDGVAQTWKLGDILNSNPTVVGSPAEGLDTKYGDTSYTSFFEKYKNRRQVVYVGANDGMLHAFNGGFFHLGDDKGRRNDPRTTPDESLIEERGFFTTGTTTNLETAPPLGQELWGFIPQELLPHLKWLTETDYNQNRHVFYVDGSPRITDARIFPSDDIHPNGWGTILIGSMRMGGGVFKVDLDGNGSKSDTGEDQFRSAYFAFDITDPEKPFGEPGNKLMWVFKDNDLGFTTSVPAIVRMGKDSTGKDIVYTVFGSGPLTYRGERNASLAGNRFQSPTPSEYGIVYVVNLETGALVGKHIEANDRYAFMGSPTAVDLEADSYLNPPNPPIMDYITDAVYIGKTFGITTGSGTTTKLTWSGKMNRILTNKKTSPADDSWTYSVLFNTGKPVLVAPTVTTDILRNPWVIFGTGRLFSAGPGSDQQDTSLQALYGINEGGTDGCWNTQQGIWKTSCKDIVSTLEDVTNAGGIVTVGGICRGCGKMASTTDTIFDRREKNEDKGGWVLNLTARGERMLSRATLFARVVLVPSYTPDLSVGACATLGSSSLYATYYGTGTAYADPNKPKGPLGLLADTGSATDIVLRKRDLGVGMASAVSLVIGSEGNATAVVRSNTGVDIQIDLGLTFPLEGAKLFLEKSE